MFHPKSWITCEVGWVTCIHQLPFGIKPSSKVTACFSSFFLQTHVSAKWTSAPLGCCSWRAWASGWPRMVKDAPELQHSRVLLLIWHFQDKPTPLERSWGNQQVKAVIARGTWCQKSFLCASVWIREQTGWAKPRLDGTWSNLGEWNLSLPMVFKVPSNQNHSVIP